MAVCGALLGLFPSRRCPLACGCGVWPPSRASRALFLFEQARGRAWPLCPLRRNVRTELSIVWALHRQCRLSAAFRLRSPWSRRALTIQGWYPSFSLEVDMTRARGAGRNRRTSCHERERMRRKDRRISSQSSGSVQDETADVTIKTASLRRGRSVDRSSIGPREDRRQITFAKAHLRR
jgi:hypothetical protein